MTWLLILAVAMVGIFVVGILSKYRIAHLEAQRQQMDVFYAVASRIAEDSNTPVCVMELLPKFSETMLNKQTLYELIWDAFSGKLRHNAENPSPKVVEFAREFEKMPAYLKAEFGKLLGAWLLALTFSSVILGAFVRRVMLFAVKMRNNGPSSGDTVKPIMHDLVERRFRAAW